MPDRDRQREQQRVEHGLCSSTLITKIDDGERRRPPARAASRTSAARPGTRSRAAAGPARRDPAELGPRHRWRPRRRHPTRLHDRAHQRAAGQLGQRRPGGDRCRGFPAGTDSPVSTDSSHSSPATASSRRSAGTTSPSCRSTTSPGTSSVTSIDARMPVAQHDAAVADLRVQCLGGLLGAVLVPEPEADRRPAG